MSKILVTYGVPCFDPAALAPHEVLIPPPREAFSRERLLEIIPQCEAVLVCTPLDRELIDAGTRLRLIVSFGAGYDAIDMRAATERGIPVCNMPDSVTETTAELTMALMLALARRIPELDAATRAGRDAFGMGKRMGVALTGKTLGIVGMGRIGARVAEMARAFGMRIVYTTHAPKPAQEALGARFLPLEALMAEADFISLHCPHTPETERLISREMIARMKPEARLVNTSRGRVVDEQALIEALRDGRVAGAALDVYEREPEVSAALCALPNVVLTPHAGSNTVDARALMAREACAHLLRGLSGERPDDLLNPEVWKEEKA